jgi:hypothetical protein
VPSYDDPEDNPMPADELTTLDARNLQLALQRYGAHDALALAQRAGRWTRQLEARALAAFDASQREELERGGEQWTRPTAADLRALLSTGERVNAWGETHAEAAERRGRTPVGVERPALVARPVILAERRPSCVRRGGGRPRARRAVSRSTGGGSSGDPDEPESGEARPALHTRARR